MKTKFSDTRLRTSLPIVLLGVLLAASGCSSAARDDVGGGGSSAVTQESPESPDALLDSAKQAYLSAYEGQFRDAPAGWHDNAAMDQRYQALLPQQYTSVMAQSLTEPGSERIAYALLTATKDADDPEVAPTELIFFFDYRKDAGQNTGSELGRCGGYAGGLFNCLTPQRY
jgi:hypothetical protein